MLDWLARRLEVSPTVAALLLVLIIAQLATQIYAIVDLVRRDSVRGGKKWVWAIVILFANLPGAIVYLAAGRTPPQVDVPSASGASAAGGEAVKRAVDALYGSRDSK